MTQLSCHRFLSNEVRLWLSVLSYNLGNLWRRLHVAESKAGVGQIERAIYGITAVRLTLLRINEKHRLA
jgi:hypothetical protein